jgi:hypothetical protein
VIATEHQGYAALAFSFHQQGLEASLGIDAEMAGKLLDGPDTGSRYFFHRCRRRRPGDVVRHGSRHLHVCRVISVERERYGILAGIGKHMELVGHAATDRAGIRLDRPEREVHSPADGGVGVVHPTISPLEARLVEVKRICVLHDEFTGTHHPEAGPNLVPELGLNLVVVDRELPIALQIAAGDVGDDFLVSRPETETSLVPIVKS